MLMFTLFLLLILILLFDYLRARGFLARCDSLEGQLVLVTGAAGGLGRQLVLEFLRAGAVVACWDVREVALHELREWLTREHGIFPDAVRCATVDVADASAVADAARKLSSDFGATVRVVVSNAGLMRGKLLLDVDVDQLRHDIGVNILSHFWIARVFLRQMFDAPSAPGSGKARPHGILVTIGSVMAEWPAIRLADYCASKAAVAQMHECMRWELAARAEPHDVRLLHVQPYAIDTPMLDGAALLGRGSWLRYVLLRRVLPPLDPAFAARCIVRAVQTRRERIVLPWVVGWMVLLLTLLPSGLRDMLIGFAGARRGMEGFRGRAGLVYTPR